MNRDRVMQRMLRQRQEMESKRAQVTQRGAVDINQVDQATYRDDLGFNMTGAGYEEYVEEKSKFDKNYGDVVGSNRTALEKLLCLLPLLLYRGQTALRFCLKAR